MFNNLIQVIQYFADEKRCKDYLIKMRWPEGITCLYCKHSKVYELKGANQRFKCAKCRKQFSATKGSIFENSAIPLQKWFTAIYLITEHKKGISSLQLSRDISVTQKTAWFMLQRIREAYSLDISEDLIGGEGVIVEVDETYIGGKNSTMSNKKRKEIAEMKAAGHGMDTKTGVIGFLERSGRLTLQVMKSDTSINEYVAGNVAKDSVLMTDAHTTYKKIGRSYAFHGVVDHGKSEYAKDKVIHVNSLEGAFSHFDRMVIGTYHHISPKHMQRYLNEHMFRFNTRKQTNHIRFENMVSCVNTRITYKKLISNDRT